MSAYTSVRIAQIRTWAIAQRLTGYHGDVCRGIDMMSPPWCLRVQREHRTQAIRMFRNLVALAAWAERHNRGNRNG